MRLNGYILLFVFCCVLQFPKVKDISGFRIIDHNDSLLIAQVDVTIYNPNIFGFRLKYLNYSAYISNYFFAQGQIDSYYYFPPKSLVRLDSQVVAIYFDDIDKILMHLGQLDSVPVSFKLKAKFKNIILPVFWKKTIYVNTADLLAASINYYNIRQLLRIKSVVFKQIGLSDSELIFKFIFKNDYPLDFVIDSVRVDIYDKRDFFLGTTYLSEVIVKARSQTVLPFVLSINNFNFIISLLGQYIDQNIVFKMRGFIDVKIHNTFFRLPIDEQFVINIELE